MLVKVHSFESWSTDESLTWHKLAQARMLDFCDFHTEFAVSTRAIILVAEPKRIGQVVAVVAGNTSAF